MEILLADSTPDRSIDALTALGHRCRLEPGLDGDSLGGALGDVDALVVRSTPVSSKALAGAGQLSLVVRAGAGVNTIDVEAASRLGIFVSNVPGRNAIAVAELTFGLLLAVDRRIPDNVADLRAGVWAKKEYSQAEGLHGKSIGIVGLGNIGMAVAKRALAFGMPVLTLDRDRLPDEAETVRSLGIEAVPDLNTLARSVDVLSIHVPGSVDTKGLIDADVLEALGTDGILLNTSRGDVVDEAALLDLLDRGLRAGLDVYADEPESGSTRIASRVASHANVVGTHHIGASTEQAQRAVADGVVEVLRAFALGEIKNCVNLETAQLGNAMLRVRHYDRVGVLAHILAVLRNNDLSVKQMQNQVFLGSTAAVAVIGVAGELTPAVISEIEAGEHVIAVTVPRSAT